MTPPDGSPTTWAVAPVAGHRSVFSSASGLTGPGRALTLPDAPEPLRDLDEPYESIAEPSGERSHPRVQRQLFDWWCRLGQRHAQYLAVRVRGERSAERRSVVASILGRMDGADSVITAALALAPADDWEYRRVLLRAAVVARMGASMGDVLWTAVSLGADCPDPDVREAAYELAGQSPRREATALLDRATTIEPVENLRETLRELRQHRAG